MRDDVVSLVSMFRALHSRLLGYLPNINHEPAPRYISFTFNFSVRFLHGGFGLESKQIVSPNFEMVCSDVLHPSTTHN